MRCRPRPAIILSGVLVLGSTVAQGPADGGVGSVDARQEVRRRRRRGHAEVQRAGG